MITAERKQEIWKMGETDAIDDYQIGQVHLLDIRELNPEDVGLNTLEELQIYVDGYNSYINE